MVDFIEKSIIRSSLESKKTNPYAPVVDSILKDVAERLQRAAKDEESYLDEIRADPHKVRKHGDIQAAEREFVVALFREWYNGRSRPLPPGTHSMPRS